MKLSLLPLLLGALCLSSQAFGQDDLPYYQQQRLVVIFNLAEDLESTTFSGATMTVLQKGTYRFDAVRKTQGVLTPENLQDGTGPFVRYGGSMTGEVRRLGQVGSSGKQATVHLKLTDTDLSSPNVVRAAEVEIQVTYHPSSGSTSYTRHKGDVAHNGGSHVVGTLEREFVQQGLGIEIYHVKLSLDDHLPIARPLDEFPAAISAQVRPTPVDDGGFHAIEATPLDFSLSRLQLNSLGAVYYDGDAHFPMVSETDWYGTYHSAPHRGEVVIMEDGRIWIQLGWGLSGRYHGWGYDYTAILTPDEYEQLTRDGAVTVTGTAHYGFASEDDVVDLDTPCEVRLTTSTSSSGGIASALAGQ